MESTTTSTGGAFTFATLPAISDMLTIFKKNEIEDNPNSILNFGDLVLKKFGISCPAGTVIKINGKDIPVFTGVFELGMNQIDITSLEFSEAVDVNIYYMY